MGVVLGSQNTCMNALFGTVSKLSFAFLAVQKANSALGQDCADDGHRAWLGARGWWWGAIWGGHVGSYRRRGFFSQGSARSGHQKADLRHVNDTQSSSPVRTHHKFISEQQ
ncbi:hypothetical protein B472_14380 [Limnohabitans sp. Rim28]|jgi:hypothetical protein|nr:hypothetical protein B472_14380 [Limnohabitans sp. Rim28]